MGFNSLLAYLGIPGAKFDSELWQSHPNLRKSFIKNIIDTDLAIGMNESQIMKTFGADCKMYTIGVWSYHIPTLSLGRAKRYLNFYFDKDGIVVNVKIKTRKRLVHR